MGTRVFGAVRGAGSQVRETQPAPPIRPGVLGFSLLVAAFRSGPVGEAVVLEHGESQYGQIYGGLTRDSQGPLSASHFYQLGQGAGKLCVVRVTDGTEVKAALKLYDRQVSRSILWRAPASRVAQVPATVKAHNGGRWGGRAIDQSGTSATALTTTTIEIPFNGGGTVLPDQFKGAILSFPSDLPGETYVIAGNTDDAPAVFTVEGQLSAAAQLLSDAAWVLSLPNEHEITGDFEGVEVEIADSAADPVHLVTVLGYRDGALRGSWTDADFNANGRRFLPTKISGDTGNYLVEWVDSFAGNVNDPLCRPANYAEIPTVAGISAGAPNLITLQTWRWQRTAAGAGNAWISTVTHGSAARACVITLTFTTATAFTVAAVLDGGGEIIGDLPAGSTAASYDPGTALLPTFRARAGSSAMSAGDVITLYVRPIPLGIGDKNGYLFVAASDTDGNVRKRYKIVNNTATTVTLGAAVDLTTDVDAPGVPRYTSANAGPYTLTSGNTVKYTLPGQAEVSLAHATTGATTATATAAILQALEDTSAGGPTLRRVLFGVSSADKLTISAFNSAGAEAILTIGAGTENTALGFTTSETAVGTDGTIVRLQWRQELRGGYDGLAGLTEDHIAAALDVEDSPANELLGLNTGLIEFATPGWATDVVRQAGTRWAWSTNSVYLPETPDTIVDEGDAQDDHAGWALSAEQMGYQAGYFPTYGSVSNPYGAGLYTASILGAIMGVHARFASENEGYHLAPAGVQYDIGSIFRDLTTGSRILNNETLNGYGLNEVRKRGSRIYPWGDRIALGDGSEPLFLHKRKTLSHIGRVFLTNTDGLVWRPVNERSFKLTIGDVRDLMFPWFKTGWFSDDAGQSFEDQVEIKCDGTNNPLASRQAGNLAVEVGVLVVDTAERVIFTLGPRSVSESTG